MEIPFIRTYPVGEPKVVKFKTDARVEDMAHKFLRSGGRYMMRVHPPQKGEPNVELVAAIPANTIQGHIRVCEAWCFDDPSLPYAVDQLVVDSISQTRAAVVH